MKKLILILALLVSFACGATPDNGNGFGQSGNNANPNNNGNGTDGNEGNGYGNKPEAPINGLVLAFGAVALGYSLTKKDN